MSESLFNIFGDHLTGQVLKNVARQPLTNIENMGKTVSAGPTKPNEPIKKSEGPKKSFLSNAGKTLRNTPVRNALTPRAINVGSMIYNEESNERLCGEDVEFHKPSNIFDNYQRDLFDCLYLREPEILKEISPPNTPPPNIKRPTMDLMDCSYEDEFFKDDFSIENVSDDDLGLPELPWM